MSHCPVLCSSGAGGGREWGETEITSLAKAFNDFFMYLEISICLHPVLKKCRRSFLIL